MNKVIIIDEPEIHLYPSQKRWLGKQLVELAKKEGKQVFLVTHDPIILQGILDANTTTNIFRVERDSTAKGVIRSCEMQQFADVNAIRNQEQYLQGLFYQRCIVVEGASDRSFYQNILDFDQITDKDLGFVVSGGKASSKHMAVLAAKVGLKCAFIFDLDVAFFQTSVLKDVYALMGGKDQPLEDLEQALNESEAVRNAKDDKERNSAIKSLTGYSDKTGISGDWASKHQTVVHTLLERLGIVCIFLVPSGTLESWAPDVTPKVRFAELAPEIVRQDATLSTKLTAFLQKVLIYLNVIAQ